MKKIFLGIITCNLLIYFESKSLSETLIVPSETNPTYVETNQNSPFYESFMQFQNELTKLNQKNENFFKDLFSDDPNLKEKLLNYKVNLESQLKDYQRISQEIKNLKISEQIDIIKNYLEKISAIVNEKTSIQSGNKNPELSSESDIKETDIQIIAQTKNKENKSKKNNQQQIALEEVDWTSVQRVENLLRGFYNAIGTYNISYNRVKEWGYKFFENNNFREIFKPNQKIPPSLKNIFTLIYDTRYPEALKTWRTIKVNEVNEDYPKNLDILRSQIKSFLKNVSSILRQHKKLENNKN